jgi:hypothetical protein
MGLQGLEGLEVLFFLLLQFQNQLCVIFEATFDERLKLRFFTLSDDRLLCSYLFHKLVNIGSVLMVGYSGERLSKSMDLVSTSPLFLTYSSNIPGG